MQPRDRDILYLLGPAYYRMALTCWGDPHADPVICVHGLSRNARDFDILAEALSDRFYVICPDLPGRGRSEWLSDPSQYQPISYVQALSHLLAFVDRPVDWIGTSLGGICGMLVASARGNPIRRMVLNDIGPFIPEAAFARIRDYVGTIPEFSDLAEAETYLRQVHAPFGDLTAAQWAAMAQHSVRPLPDGRLTLHYDPAMTVLLRDTPPADSDMWRFWDAITAPMLAIRGAESDLLLPEIFERMAAKAERHTVENAGHAPALMDVATIDVIRTYFLK